LTERFSPTARRMNRLATAAATVITMAPAAKVVAMRRGLSEPRKTAITTSAVGEMEASKANPAASAITARSLTPLPAETGAGASRRSAF